MSNIAKLLLVSSAALILTTGIAKAAPGAWGAYPRTDTQAKASELEHWHLVASAVKAQPDVLFLGDSTVAGWACQGLRAWKYYLAPLNSFNAGIGGETTQSIIWRLDHEALDGISPSIVVLMIGTNNLNVETPEQTQYGIAAILQAIRHKLPLAKILLLGILPRSTQLTPLWLQQRILKENILESGLKSEHVTYLNIGSKLNPSNKANFLPDGVHPSMVGYLQIGRPIADAIRKLKQAG